MKRIILASTMLISASAFADIDYSRCTQATNLGLYGVNINNDGKVEPAQHMQVKSRSTEGLVETLVLETNSGFGKGMEMKVTIERDEQGRVIRASTGGERPDPKTIEMYKKYYSAPAYGGWGTNTEPVFQIDGSNVPLEKVTKEQAKKAGFDKNVDEYKRLKSQRRKDKKTLEKMNEVYSKIHAKADYVIPFGQEAEFDIKDGLCLVKNVSSKNYSTKTKDVSKQLLSSREGCEEVQKLYKKYETKLNECSDVQAKLNNEYYENFYKKKMQHSPYMMGGYAGGYAGGMVGGYVTGGMAGGMVGGYGMGMGNHGLISGELYSCEYTYGVGPVPSYYPGTTGGIVGGSSESSKQ